MKMSEKLEYIRPELLLLEMDMAILHSAIGDSVEEGNADSAEGGDI